jgi:hypothetical protein
MRELLAEGATQPVPINRFIVMGNVNGMSAAMRNELQTSGVAVQHVSTKGRKEASDKALLVEFGLAMRDHTPPFGIAIITGDSDFSYAVSTACNLGYRTAVFAPNALQCSPFLTNSADLVFSFVRDVLTYCREERIQQNIACQEHRSEAPSAGHSTSTSEALVTSLEFEESEVVHLSGAEMRQTLLEMKRTVSVYSRALRRARREGILVEKIGDVEQVLNDAARDERKGQNDTADREKEIGPDVKIAETPLNYSAAPTCEEGPDSTANKSSANFGVQSVSSSTLAFATCGSLMSDRRAKLRLLGAHMNRSAVGNTLLWMMVSTAYALYGDFVACCVIGVIGALSTLAIIMLSKLEVMRSDAGSIYGSSKTEPMRAEKSEQPRVRRRNNKRQSTLQNPGHL